MRQAALSASGVRKGDHIVDPRTGAPVRGRLAAWVALPRPAQPRDTGPRLAPAAVADALTTAFMLLSARRDRGLVRAQPRPRGVVLPDGGSMETTDLRHFGGPADEARVYSRPTTAGED
jgi:thiamine biosynthesis lipoprotein ApbE